MSLRPSITILKDEQVLERLWLDSNRNQFSVGASNRCDLSTLKQKHFDFIPWLRWSSSRLHMQWPDGLPITIHQEDDQLTLEKLQKSGQAKLHDHMWHIVLTPHSNIHGSVQIGEYSLLFDFTPAPEITQAAPLLTWEHAKANLLDIDWVFVFLVITMVGSALWGGKMLQNLPTPLAKPVSNDGVVFRFSRVTLPPVTAAAVSQPPSAQADPAQIPGSTPSPGFTSSTRVQAKVDRLLGRLDRMAGMSHDPVAGNHSLTLGDTATSDAAANTRAFKLPKLDLTTPKVTENKTMASLEPATPAAPIRPRAMPLATNLVVRNAQHALRQCYEDALMQQSSLAGKLTLTFALSASGQATQLQIDADAGIQHPGFFTCIKGVIQRLAFEPNSGDLDQVRFSMIFSPNRR